MVHNLTGNTHSGKKWWLLKHGRLVQIGGILLIMFVPVIIVFFAIQNLSLFNFEILLISIMFLLIVSFFVIFWIFFSGSAYANLYSIIKELDLGWVIEDFDPLRYKILIRDKARQYVILYHSHMSLYAFWVDKNSLIFSWNQLPDHYQVWTQYGGGSVQHNRYDLAKHVRAGVSRFFFGGLVSSDQGEIIFDENLRGTVPHLHKEAKQISSLRFVGFAREGVEIVLAAYLVQKGGKDVIQVLDLLKKITQGTKEYRPFDDEWS
jgi:hypothetical protein